MKKYIAPALTCVLIALSVNIFAQTDTIQKNDSACCHKYFTDTVLLESFFTDSLYMDFVILDTLGDQLVIKTMVLGIVIGIPDKKPVPEIRPDDIPESHESFILCADSLATCYSIELHERMRTVWLQASTKKKRKQAWNGNTFLKERFGKAKKYRHIKKCKKRAKRCRKWLVNSKVVYVDKRRENRRGHDATSIPWPPTKIKLYRGFFKLSCESAGALIIHELIHEGGIMMHRAKRYKTDSNSWNTASLKLAKKKPKKAKKSPYCFQTAVQRMGVKCAK